ncbi:MAG TPA: ABC transporter ATP-binding protein [Rectinema sp.]|jgi:ATP-binding cassette subfamily B protein|nr:ABC transporter ATP-binding protein [Rectinema sp.]HOH04736.1 ABC transporter ATP-binding protein [Rectinema sp.]HOM92038.1 ABC transporter ATP-binding protein [Rectinema sp.]HOR47807.1 ABC transporter ATP-binding protein [Rectinema sp.]HOU06463.1 ABC transporter ATP-binding protein [Rectinema sp.]
MNNNERQEQLNNSSAFHETQMQRRPGAKPVRPGRRALMAGEKSRDFKGTMKKLIAYLGPYHWPILCVMILAIVSTILAILGPKVLGNATTALFEGVVKKLTRTGDIDFAKIKTILLTVLVLYVSSSILQYLQGWVLSGIAVKITYSFRKDILAKINRMPFKAFDNTNHGEILSRITNDVDVVNQTLTQTISQMIHSIMTIIGVFVMMLTISWQMTIVALVTIPLSLIVVRVIVKRSQKYFRIQQEYLGHVNGHIEEIFSSHIVVKAYGGEERAIQTFNELNSTLYQSAWKSHFLSSIMMPLMNFVGNIGYVAVAVSGGWLAAKKMVTVGDIQAFLQYVRQFTQPIVQIANISNVLQQTAAAAERIFDFLASEEEKDVSIEMGQKGALVEIPESIKGKVEFRHVCFGYLPDQPIIKDFSATILPGQKVAIVGPTGAGKTTLVKLLMRFYDPDSGEILVDDIPIRSLPRSLVRSWFGMVLQDTWLFSGTVKENIAYGKRDATEAEIVEAAKAAHVDHFVRALPEGYNLEINEETTNISQGQMQLLTIARAMLAQPPMLILDEATSNVDTHTELLIQRAMGLLMQGRTSFVIAHRLSTIRDADLILVMDHGDIVEQGTHEELLNKGGFYAELYNSQFDQNGEDRLAISASSF